MDNIFVEVLKLANSILLPIIIIVATVGSIYAIVLGVNYARSETADKREEAKGRLVHSVVGLVAMVLLLIGAQLLASNADSIVGLVRNTAGNDTVTVSITLPADTKISSSERNSVSFWSGKGFSWPTGWSSTDQGIKVDSAVKLSDTVWKVVFSKPKPKSNASLIHNLNVNNQQYNYSLSYGEVIVL